jgi:hypothetical protein
MEELEKIRSIMVKLHNTKGHVTKEAVMLATYEIYQLAESIEDGVDVIEGELRKLKAKEA